MKYYLLGFGISLLFAGLSFFVSTHLAVGASVLLIFLAAFSFIIVPQILQREEKERKRHECYHFVNAFLISLSVTQSVQQAFLAASQETEGEEGLILNSLSDSPVNEKIDYLGGYFEESYYPMFLSIFQLFLDQGGDLLALAEPLLKETANRETTQNALAKIQIRFLVQFITLWFMSALVLAFIRLGLSSFYDGLADSFPFQATIVCYFAIAIASFCAFSIAFNDGKLELRRKKHVSAPSN